MESNLYEQINYAERGKKLEEITFIKQEQDATKKGRVGGVGWGSTLEE